MPIKGRKIVAFITANIIFISMFFTALFVAPDVLKIIGKIIIIMIFATNITFIGGNTLDKWIKSKYFRPELFNQNGGDK